MVPPQAGDCEKMEKTELQQRTELIDYSSTQDLTAHGVEEKPEMQFLQIRNSPSGHALKKPFSIMIPKPKSPGEEALQRFIIDSFSWKMHSLIPFTFSNKSVMKLVKYLFSYGTQSTATMYQYIYGVYRFSQWVGKQSDQMVRECLDEDGLVNPKRQQVYDKLLEDFIGDLQAARLAPGTINNYVKSVKTLFRVSDIKLNLPYRLKKRVVYRDRSPTPQELSKLIDAGDLREKTMISLLALGGFRVGTLCKLDYRHVRRDMEAGVVPIHLHVEAEITKGKYTDYDTFISQEAADYLKTYLEFRRNGSPRDRMPPETITDDSPLIRAKISREVKPLRPASVHQIIHNLYLKAGIMEHTKEKRYELNVHSIRKYFRTQMAALGVPTDYIEYMMGHVISTYHDIEMKGIDYLRGIYASSGLSIKPKSQLNKLEMLKTIIRAYGLDPDKVLVKEALAEPHRFIQPDDYEQQIQTLNQTLREIVTKELATISSPKTV